MLKLDRITLKALPFIIVLAVLAWAMFFLANQVKSTQRGNYHNISKVDIKYPYSATTAVYNIEYNAKTVAAIVNDINSQSYGKWRESIGGKEASSAVSINLYSNTETLVASFSLYPTSLLERAHNYSQLNAQGFHRQINIKQLSALREVWCDRRNTDDYNLSRRGKYCKGY